MVMRGLRVLVGDDVMYPMIRGTDDAGVKVTDEGVKVDEGVVTVDIADGAGASGERWVRMRSGSNAASGDVFPM